MSVPLGANRYYRGEGYIETDMDTGSSAAAASLCGRCRGLSRKIDVELGIVLQASTIYDSAVSGTAVPVSLTLDDTTVDATTNR